jgi:hypothetical protein
LLLRVRLVTASTGGWPAATLFVYADGVFFRLYQPGYSCGALILFGAVQLGVLTLGLYAANV